MIVDSMSKKEVMAYIRKEYDATVLPFFLNHLKLYQVKIYPVCERGKQNKVTLSWEKIISKNKTVFHLQVYGDKDGIDSVCVAEFDWQNQHCLAYIKQQLMIVFSQHALKRYAERVLEGNFSYKECFNLILKDIALSYRTVLPSPTHPLCYYFVFINALFLGDFDESTYYPNQYGGHIWLNTCISLKEAGTSQKGILKTLSQIPFLIKDIGFSPFEPPLEENYKKTDKLFSSGNKKCISILYLSQLVFLIDKLFVMMDLPVSKNIIDVFYYEMKYAGSLLEMGGIDTSKLTPYGTHGIAIRGELDYRVK